MPWWMHGLLRSESRCVISSLWPCNGLSSVLGSSEKMSAMQRICWWKKKGKIWILFFSFFYFIKSLTKFILKEEIDITSFYSIDWGLLSMLRKYSISLISALQPHGCMSKLCFNHEKMCRVPYRDTRKSTFQRMLWRKDW